MVFPIAGSNTVAYTIKNPTGEYLYPANGTSSQTFNFTGSAHGGSKAVHGAGRIVVEFGATVRSTGSFSVDDRLTRDNS